MKLTRLPPTRNYGPTVLVQREAQKRGCEQVLWLYGPDQQLTEVGTMNIFIYWTHKDGGELSDEPTPALGGVAGDSLFPQRLQCQGFQGWDGVGRGLQAVGDPSLHLT